LLLGEASAELPLSKAALEKRCDRGSIDYYLDSKGRRRIPFHVIEEWGMAPMDAALYDYDPKFDIPKSELWGNGKAPVIKLPRSQEWITVGGVNDIHVPWHDAELVDAAIDLFKDLQPDLFIINGDMQDFFGLSRFNKSFERLDNLQNELDQGKALRAAFRSAMPNAAMHETLGNHEERLLTYPGFNAPALKSLNSLKPDVLMGLKELDIKHWPRNGFRLNEEFLVEHGAVVRKNAGDTAKQRLNETLISGVMGHVHRLGQASRSGYKEINWYETGCLCQLNPDYVTGEANWQQGIWVGTFSTRSTNYNIQLIPASGRGFIFNGKHYGNTNDTRDIWVGPMPNFEMDIPSDFSKVVTRTW